jgi:hypothetical protein
LYKIVLVLVLLKLAVNIIGSIANFISTLSHWFLLEQLWQ